MKNILRGFLGALLLILDAVVLAIPTIGIAMLAELCWPLAFLEILMMPITFVTISYGAKKEWKIFTYPIELMSGLRAVGFREEDK